jgi:uncharacterized repeat protein (TIGR03803 family)
LLVDASGNLFGTTSLGSDTPCDGGDVNGCGIVFELLNGSNGYPENALYSFGSTSATNDGASPYAGLIADAAGNFYGTTAWGGTLSTRCDLFGDAGGPGQDGCGTVFELVKSGTGCTENVLYAFTGPDGADPYAGLTMDSSGNLYGTTYNGGACALGAAFELIRSPAGYTEEVLHSFGCVSTDGWYPNAALLMDAAGNLYGTAESAGDLKACGGFGCGIVFELVNSNGDYSEKILYSFRGSDGQIPAAGLISDASGNLYGTTEAGGAPGSGGVSGSDGYGTVFELVNSSGSYTEKVLYSFKGPSAGDGQAPTAALVMDQAGDLYGTTNDGGTYCLPEGCGIAFELLNSSGSYAEKILHSFGAPGDGEYPVSPLVMDSAGNLYGTTGGGGVNFGGSVFLINPTANAPVATLSGSELAFDSQLVKTSSPTQAITVTNTGSSNLNFPSGGVTITGSNAADFSVSANTCSGADVAPGAACAAKVTFTPSFVGSESASLNIADNAATSPQTVRLSGTGVTSPAVTLSTGSLAFSTEPVGSMSATQTVSVKNTGGSALAVSNLTISTGFSETNTCGLSVVPGGSCMLTVEFVPTTIGPFTGTLSIFDNAPDSPQIVSLAGTGMAPVASVSPKDLVFGSLNIGATSGPQIVTISNAGNATLTLSSIAITGTNAGNFAIASNGTTCATNDVVSDESNCLVDVTFTPTGGGTRYATLSITDNSNNQAGNEQSVALSGSGQDFGLAVLSGTPSTATVTPGNSASYAVNVSPEGGFDQIVALACTGAPSGATCSVNPSTISVNGSSASTATVTVSTTASVASLDRWPNGIHRGLPAQPALLGIWLMLVGSLGLVAMTSRTVLRRRGQMALPLDLLMLAAILASATLAASCGGSRISSPPPNPGTPPETYTLTVTGTSGNLSHSTSLTLTVN